MSAYRIVWKLPNKKLGFTIETTLIIRALYGDHVTEIVCSVRLFLTVSSFYRIHFVTFNTLIIFKIFLQSVLLYSGECVSLCMETA